MKQYIGIKVVAARPMTRGDYNIFRGWQIPADEDPADEGYVMKYENGHVQWLPKDMFESDYKEVKQYKEPPFMNTLRKRIFVAYPDAEITYGSETTPKRKAMKLDKTHYNDAIVISGINEIKENPEEWLLIKQFRKKKRSLHEATARKGRKKPNRNQTRNSKNTPYYKGFYLNDKVSVFGKSGYITGFTSNAAYIKDENNDYITLPNKTYKQVSINKMKLECHNNNWQYIIKNAV